MPKGQSPRSNMLQREATLSSKLSNSPRDYSSMSRIRRVLRSLQSADRSVSTPDSQAVVTQKRSEEERRLATIRRSLARNAQKLSGGPL